MMQKDVLLTVGSHTCSHEILTRMKSSHALESELLRSREIIQEHTGQDFIPFCYPNGQPGDFDTRTQQAIKKYGYACALTSIAGVNRDVVDLYALRRQGAGTSLDSFIYEVSGVRDLITVGSQRK